MNANSDPTVVVWQLIQVKPAIITILAVVVIGYLLKCVPQVFNQRIPAYIVLFASILYFGLVDPVPHGTQNIITTVVLGAFVGVIAWVFHFGILKHLLDANIPFLRNAGNNQTTKQDT
jgi:hypothetical protein